MPRLHLFQLPPAPATDTTDVEVQPRLGRLARQEASLAPFAPRPLRDPLVEPAGTVKSCLYAGRWLYLYATDLSTFATHRKYEEVAEAVGGSMANTGVATQVGSDFDVRQFFVGPPPQEEIAFPIGLIPAHVDGEDLDIFYAIGRIEHSLGINTGRIREWTTGPDHGLTFPSAASWKYQTVLGDPALEQVYDAWLLRPQFRDTAGVGDSQGVVVQILTQEGTTWRIYTVRLNPGGTVTQIGTASTFTQSGFPAMLTAAGHRAVIVESTGAGTWLQLADGLGAAAVPTLPAWLTAELTNWIGLAYGRGYIWAAYNASGTMKVAQLRVTPSEFEVVAALDTGLSATNPQGMGFLGEDLVVAGSTHFVRFDREGQFIQGDPTAVEGQWSSTPAIRSAPGFRFQLPSDGTQLLTARA